MGIHSQVRRRLVLGSEALEDRAVPATFGVPWADPTHLTLSFVPDGTPIAGHTSSLYQTLNAQAPTATWKAEILAAFQTWAEVANINIGVVADGGKPLGTDGPAQHDPRFGDIRVGAQPMAGDALSISIPNDPYLVGTWGGDVLLNSNVAFDGTSANLLATMLHEAGHVLGLDESSDPRSPMYPRQSTPQPPTATDIADLQALYGSRLPDANGIQDSFATPTPIAQPTNYRGNTPLIAWGTLAGPQDADYFSVQPTRADDDGMTVRLQSTGLSLLAPRLSIYDTAGHLLARSTGASGMGDAVTLQIRGEDRSSATYILKVEGAGGDLYRFGSYGLAVTSGEYEGSSTALQTVLRGPYQGLSANDVAQLFHDPSGALFGEDAEDGEDGEGQYQTALMASPGFAPGTHYHAVGHVDGPTDVHVYQITAPSIRHGQANVLTVTISAVAPHGATPRVSVLDAAGKPVDAQVLANGDGTYAVQVVHIHAGSTYSLRLTPAGTGSGNYDLEASFGPAAAQLDTFASGRVRGATPAAYDLYVAHSQLFQFLLSATGSGANGVGAAGSALTMTIVDSAGHVVETLKASAGDPVSAPALFLTPGPYRVQFALSGPAPSLLFDLTGEAISDPIGPVIQDPTLAPVYNLPATPKLFLYPGGIISDKPYLLVPIK
jgi:hypothetical protein